jgi:hypothetical protein
LWHELRDFRETIRDRAQQEVGFRQLAEATARPANSLMRIFGPNSNPSAKNLFGVLAHRSLKISGETSRAGRQLGTSDQ